MTNDPNNPILESTLADYKIRYARGDDERINFMKGLWGDSFSRPENISGVRAWDDGTTIDIHFKNQDHVAVYRVNDGEAVFDGFES
jgi:hypothetical protein